MSQFYRTFDHMCWPAPGERMNELEWTLRYSDPPSREECLMLASVVSAYTMLVTMTAKERANRIREIRKGPNTPYTGAQPHAARGCEK